MTDYDRSKVSPIPWEYESSGITNGFSTWILKDANGKTMIIQSIGPGVPIEEHKLSDDNLHKIHCVNMHDELVEALNEAINTICECCEHAAMTSEGDYICSKHIDGCGDTLKLRPTLTKAKGGQPDGSIDKANKDGE